MNLLQHELEKDLMRRDFDYRDLYADFEFTRELGKHASIRFDEISKLLPTPYEMDLLIPMLKNKSLEYDEEKLQERKRTLKLLKKVIIKLRD